jgi:hypothetical protein
MYIIKIKFEEKNITKKAKRDIKSFKELIDLVSELFSPEVAEVCSINYYDSDKELIMIGSDEEWEVCTEEQLEENTSKLLKISLFLIDEENKVGEINFGTSNITLNESQWSELKDEEPEVANNLMESQFTEIEPVTQVETQEEIMAAFLKKEAERKEDVVEAPKEEVVEVEEVEEKPLERGSYNIDFNNYQGNPFESPSSPVKNDTDPFASSGQVKQEEQSVFELDEFSHIEEQGPEEARHIGYTCNGCGVSPIVGARFHSMEVQDYDLCSKCEQTTHHEHPMIRFRKFTHRKLSRSKNWAKIKQLLKECNGELERKKKSAEKRGRATKAPKLSFINYQKKKQRKMSMEEKRVKREEKVEKKTAPQTSRTGREKFMYRGPFDERGNLYSCYPNMERGIQGGFKTGQFLFDKRNARYNNNVRINRDGPIKSIGKGVGQVVGGVGKVVGGVGKGLGKAVGKTVQGVGKVGEKVFKALAPAKKPFKRLNGALHPKHAQFKEVFPHVDDKILNDFLRRYAARNDPVGLWNLATNRFASK